MKNLYEFTALLECSCIVAADDEESAKKEIKNYKKAWIETGEFVDVVDVDLLDVRDAESQDEDKLHDLAHVVV